MHPLAQISLLIVMTGALIAFLRDQISPRTWAYWIMFLGFFVGCVGLVLDLTGVWPG